MRTVAPFNVCVALTFMTAVAIPAAQTPAFQKPAAPGQLVGIGAGTRLHLVCKGSGNGPTVIVEAGLSQYTASSTYGKAQDAIATFARVCVYDRAGLGWSDAIPDGRTHRGMVADLHRLLAAAEIPPPYVMVGHSMGGLLVRLYAQEYRGEVVGVVLADATPESTLFDAGAADFRAGIVAKIEEGLAKARPGVPVVPMPDGTSPDLVMSFMPEVLAAVKDEYRAIDRTPAELRGLQGYGTLGSIPLVVIRRGWPPLRQGSGGQAQPESATDASWRAEQERLPALSTNSVLVVAENSGHVIPYDEPSVVADAVRRVIDACRTNNKVK